MTISPNLLRQRVLGQSWTKEDLVEIRKVEGKQQPGSGGFSWLDQDRQDQGACRFKASLVSSAPCPAHLPEGCPADQQRGGLIRQQSL